LAIQWIEELWRKGAEVQRIERKSLKNCNGQGLLEIIKVRFLRFEQRNLRFWAAEVSFSPKNGFPTNL
jgi:hypothetical protein